MENMPVNRFTQEFHNPSLILFLIIHISLSGGKFSNKKITIIFKIDIHDGWRVMRIFYNTSAFVK